MRKNNSKKGFALPEMIVYLAIFIMVSVAVISGLVTMSTFLRKTKVYNDLNRNGQSMERVIRLIRSGSSVDGATSVFDSSPGRLVFLVPNGGGNDTYDISVASSTLILKKNGVSENLTGSSVQVSSLFFRKIASVKSTAVRIELTLASNNSSTTESFATGAVLRNSY